MSQTTKSDKPMSKRVLIVDDEPNIVISLEFLLERAGLEVLIARDGEAGLAEIRSAQPDLVILDVMMPKLDGFAVLQAVRADPVVRSTPILMLTARGRDADQKKGLVLGANAYLSKPFSTAELVERVQELLR
jgi:DNA-binding response OmpR family regulator